VATYAIGDVQGCFDSLSALLEQIGYDRRRDRLWLTGDLVNRGPRSREVLRWALDQGDAIVSVLGNHDLHFLARALGRGKSKKRDTLSDALAAPERADFVDWLRHRPLLHRDGRRAMVHAGLHPSWTLDQAAALAAEAEALLQRADWADTVATWDGPWPEWHADLAGPVRIAAAVGVMVHIRMVDEAGHLARTFKDSPDEAPPGLVPWFAVPWRRSRDHELVCGHWAALGLRLEDDLVAVDTGCVWGEALTAVRLEDRAVFRQPAVEPPSADRG
jgi:bis(5'-nucleosyl)-tetraphosphatase (symmetrical)